MPIFTPRGLKIRIDTDVAFTYIARVSPPVSPFKVLKTVEGFQFLPGMLSIIAGLICFLTKQSFANIIIIVGSACFLGSIMAISGIVLGWSLIKISRVLSLFSGYGIYLIIIVLTGLLMVGWKGLLAYYIAKIGITTMFFAIDYLRQFYSLKLYGDKLTDSERYFFNTIRLYLISLNREIDLDLKEGEVESGVWKKPLSDLVKEWPEVTNRFY